MPMSKGYASKVASTAKRKSRGGKLTAKKARPMPIKRR